MKGANNTYFGNIRESISSLTTGLKLTFKHLWEARSLRKPIGVEHPDYFKQDTGVITLQYPFESLPVPDNGRYRLHNEIDDCIVCDKCAKVCPVNCIDIEPVKATEDMGVTSDGTKKRIHAAKFDIDMAKCCFCGLCTTVCPTECLTMTKAYDFSEFDVKNHNYSFSEMTPLEILEKKKLLEEANLAKETAKKQVLSSQLEEDTAKELPKPKAAFKPRVKAKTDSAEVTSKPKPKFRPKVKSENTDIAEEKSIESTSKPKPSFRPKIKKKAEEATSSAIEPKTDKSAEGDALALKVGSTAEDGSQTGVESEKPKAIKAKPVFRPKIKKKADAGTTAEKTTSPEGDDSSVKPKPKFRPKIKPKNKTNDGDDDQKKD